MRKSNFWQPFDVDNTPTTVLTRRGRTSHRYRARAAVVHAKTEALSVEGQLKSAATRVANLGEMLGDAMSVLSKDRAVVPADATAEFTAASLAESEKVRTG